MTATPALFPHRRFNPLTGEWIQVSPQRMLRPWLGQVEKTVTEALPTYDPQCYLCPGNERAGGLQNPVYENIFVFDNDYPVLLANVPPQPTAQHPLLQTQSVPGVTRVICFSPRHNLTLPEMACAQIRQVVDTWAQQTAELGKTYRWIQVFENKGQIMGCSNPHPHGQIFAIDTLPNEALKEDKRQRQYYQKSGSSLLRDYADLEMARGERVVLATETWLALVPFWAAWPFEVILLPRRPVLRLPDLTDAERDGLATILKRLLTRYDNLFETSFPYAMGWHGAPYGRAEPSHWQLHAHFYPPLLRSATVKKFMVGYELLSEIQRDLTAEQAAERLRSAPEIHYKER
jgi:UDPglucose--hexose-1-phosphate uridylyltransferase